MLGFALRRLLVAVPTLFALLALSFALMHAAPGGPFDSERALPPEVEARLRAEYRLDAPLAAQFGDYLAGLARGDLGPSFQYPGQRVSALIAAGAPASAMLGLAALALAAVLGIATGLAAALQPGTRLDRALMALAVLGLSLPAYVTAPLLILLFAVALGWLPAGGWDGPASAVLPVLALAAPQVAMIARLTRVAALDVLAAPFVRTARAKGLGEAAVVLRHVLKPSLLPVVAYLGPAAAALVTGSVVVEQVFGIPGIGRHFVQGALNRDYTLVLGVVLFYGLLVIAFNFLVDLAQAAIDPRLARR